MKTLKLNFTIPEDVAQALKSRVKARKRSAFVADAVRSRLKEMEDEQLKELLIKGYKATDKEMSRLDKEMETATFENLGDVL